MLHGPRRSRLAVIAGLAVLWGCGEDETGELRVPVPTEIAVHPEDFMGEVRCSTNAGAMRSYVITLRAWDSADDVTPFPVGSSLPTPCSLIAGFRDPVVVGQRYTVEIDGYELPPERLAPLGGLSSGARTMVDRDSGVVVEPRWRAHCGDSAANAAVALENRRVFVRPCQELVDSTSSVTAIELAPQRLMGTDDPCSVAGNLLVTDERGRLPAVGLSCDAEPVVVEAEPGKRYELYVRAHRRQVAAPRIPEPDLGTVCQVDAVANQTAVPVCPPLSATGSARVSLAGVTTSEGDAACPTGSSFDVLLGGVALNAMPLPCGAAAHVGPFDPAAYTLDAVVYDALKAPVGQGLRCTAEILAGKTTDAACAP